MLARKDMIELVSHNPHLNSIHALDRTSGLQGLVSLARRLRTRPYDLVVDLHNNFRSRLMTFLLQPRSRALLKKKNLERWLLVNTRHRPHRPAKLLMERYFEPLTKYGVHYDGRGSEIHVAPEKRVRVESMLTGFANRPIVGIAPGASYAKKAFPLDRVSFVAQRIIEETPAAIVLFGGPADAKLHVDAPGRVLDLQGVVDIQEAACAASHCRVVLTNDSLMLHLAEAAGTDVVALFGPTTRDFGYFPFRPTSKVFQTDAACRPCSKHGQGQCSQKEQYCFTQIDPNQIVEEIKMRLSHPAHDGEA